MFLFPMNIFKRLVDSITRFIHLNGFVWIFRSESDTDEGTIIYGMHGIERNSDEKISRESWGSSQLYYFRKVKKKNLD